MTFKLGASSLAELNGVNPLLVRVVMRAIQITKQDFVVLDGIRTIEEQRKYVANGTSKTMKSKHLEGRAVDLVPYVEGKVRWWWPQIYIVAAAMKTAAAEYRTPIIWGTVWDKRLGDIANEPGNLPDLLKEEGLAYNARHPGRDFPDGPHYEIVL